MRAVPSSSELGADDVGDGEAESYTTDPERWSREPVTNDTPDGQAPSPRPRLYAAGDRGDTFSETVVVTNESGEHDGRLPERHRRRWCSATRWPWGTTRWGEPGRIGTGTIKTRQTMMRCWTMKRWRRRRGTRWTGSGRRLSEGARTYGEALDGGRGRETSRWRGFPSIGTGDRRSPAAEHGDSSELQSRDDPGRGGHDALGLSSQ